MSLIKLAHPDLDSSGFSDFQEILAANEVGYLGKYIDLFNQSLSAIYKDSHIGLFSSGTASIHLALALAGVGEGDEVLCQSLTFVASANPVRYLGAKPVFVGSESQSWNMCPNALLQAIKDRIRLGKKPSAIMVVHIFGVSAKMDELRAIAEEYNIPLIEDAAEALGSTWKEIPCGQLGDFGILSFNANKIITTGGGGALISSDPTLIQKAQFLALHAKDPAPHYQHSIMGYNYAFGHLNAVVGYNQMQSLEEKVNTRIRRFEDYRRNLSVVSDIQFQEGWTDSFSNRWLTAILLPERTLATDLLSFLGSKEIQARHVWKPMHLQPLYADAPYYGDRVEEMLFSRGLCLPSGGGVDQAAIKKICTLIINFLTK